MQLNSRQNKSIGDETPLSQQIELKLKEPGSRIFADYTLPDEFVLPAYGDYSISNLPNTILSHFGINVKGKSTLPERLLGDSLYGIQKLVLLVVDALGYKQLKRLLQKGACSTFESRLKTGIFLPLTSVFPSTTTAALTTLHTGATPQEHGLLGYRMYLREWGLLANMISLSPEGDNRRDKLLEMGLSTDKFLGVKTVYQQLAKAGIPSYILVRGSYKDSGLSHIHHRGARSLPFINSSDMFVQLRKLIQSKSPNSAYIFVYWDAVDDIAHRYGPNTEEHSTEIRNVLRQLEEEILRPLEEMSTQSVVLMITADHGQIFTPASKAIRMMRYKAFREDLLMPPAGEYRAMYLYAQQGKSEALKRYLMKKFPEKLVILDSQEALKNGLWGRGEIKDEVRYRIGDIVSLPRKDHILYYPYAPAAGKKIHDSGRHGGLSDEEMLVPFLCLTYK